MARIKVEVEPLTEVSDWKHADELIREIADTQLHIEQKQREAKELIDDIKADLADGISPHQKIVKHLTKSLEAFAKNNRKDFGKAQSRKLNFGLLGWRKSTAISIKKNTLELIHKIFGNKYKAYIHTKEDVNKEALKQLTEEQLASVAARRKSKEVFFVEPELPDAVDY